MSTYVPRTKQQRRQLVGATAATVERGVTLKGCGHTTTSAPELGNPSRWWCCGQFREKKP